MKDINMSYIIRLYDPEMLNVLGEPENCDPKFCYVMLKE